MMMQTSHQSMIQVGLLFRGKTQQLVILVMNALFDSGNCHFGYECIL